MDAGQCLHGRYFDVRLFSAHASAHASTLAGWNTLFAYSRPSTPRRPGGVKVKSDRMPSGSDHSSIWQVMCASHAHVVLAAFLNPARENISVDIPSVGPLRLAIHLHTVLHPASGILRKASLLLPHRRIDCVYHVSADAYTHGLRKLYPTS